MRFFRPPYLLLGAVALGVLMLVGCNRSTTNTSPPPPTFPPSAPPVSPSPSPPSSTVSKTPVTDAIQRFLAEQANAPYPVIPRGTKLLGARVQNGVAYLDFNSTFNQLANMGDTTESQAQKALRHALRGIPGVRMVAVTVEGKPFQSQMTDWTTPFPITDLSSQTENPSVGESNGNTAHEMEGRTASPSGGKR